MKEKSRTELEDAFRKSFLSGPLPDEDGDGWALVSALASRRAARRRALGYAAVLLPLFILGGAGTFHVARQNRMPERIDILAESGGEHNGGRYMSEIRQDELSSEGLSTDVADAGVPPEGNTLSYTGNSTEELHADSDTYDISDKDNSLSDSEIREDDSSPADNTQRSRSIIKTKDPSISSKSRPLLAVNFSINGSPARSGKFDAHSGTPSLMAGTAPFSPDVKVADTDIKDAYSEASFRHHTPIGTGIGLNIGIGRGVSFETGVNYTLYWSELQYKGDNGRKNQYIHYIGIPMQFDWHFFQRPKFSLFTGIGAQMDICAAARVDGTAVKEKKLQWTGVVTAGASYNFTDRFSLYLRPALDWYISKTSLNSIRNAGPVNVSVRAGLTYSF